jgi:HEAT repeat protein
MFGLSPLPRSLAAALRDAEHDRAQVRLSAVRDLARYASDDADPRARDALVARLLRDTTAEVRAAAAVALADAGAMQALPSLIEATKDARVAVRQMALLALGEVGTSGDPAVMETLHDALADEAAQLRFQAVIASHRLDVADVERILVDATADRDAEVRHVAFRSLEERSAGGATRALSAAVANAAHAGLDDSVLGVRLAAAILLARHGDTAGASVLAEVATPARRALDPEDEQAAIELAGELRLAAARRGLARRAFGGLTGRDRFAFDARIALAKMGDERARSAILRALGAWSRDARTLAVVAAGRAAIAEARNALLAMRDDPSRAEPEAVAEALALLGE